MIGSAPGRSSLLALIILFTAIVVVRIVSLTPWELTWDVFGYYVYLPALFIHGDPWLSDITWIHDVRAHYIISDTLFQLAPYTDGGWTYFFLGGMALLYLPFFLVAHGMALLTGASADGFSAPYQVCMAMGMLVYVLIGLIFLRRILLRFLPDRTAAVTILVVGFGTNYFHFMTIKDLETANALFMLMAVLVWSTLRWHEDPRWRFALGVGASMVLITLVKPSEVICLLIPLLWGAHDRASLKAKWGRVLRNWRHVVGMAAVGVLIISPQLTYWYARTGLLIYDSYKNAGIGIDLLNPHVTDVLFGFRKGWLLYTPVMGLALVGFIPLFRRQRAVALAILAYFLTSFWIISSWTEWWYGASFSIRPLITSYVLLAIPLGLVLDRILRARAWMRASALVVIGCLCGLNLFQNWQLVHGVLNPYRTTRASYCAVFGRTTAPEGLKRLLSIDRGFGAVDVFADTSGYTSRTLVHYDFERPMSGHAAHHVYDSLLHSNVFILDSLFDFSPGLEMPYAEVTTKDHAWLRASVRVRMPKGYAGPPPSMVVTVTRADGSYHYQRAELDSASLSSGEWSWMRVEYLTPAIRDPQDKVTAYVWHQGRVPIRIDDFHIQLYEPTEQP